MQRSVCPRGHLNASTLPVRYATRGCLRSSGVQCRATEAPPKPQEPKASKAKGKLKSKRKRRLVTDTDPSRTANVAVGPTGLSLEVHQQMPWDEEFKKEFLEKYWQKSPLVIRQALPESIFMNPLSPEILAGLACTMEADMRESLGLPEAEEDDEEEDSSEEDDSGEDVDDAVDEDGLKTGDEKHVTAMEKMADKVAAKDEVVATLKPRIIMHDATKNQYRQIRGPFEAELFGQLPEYGWQLMLNGVDRFVPDVSDLSCIFDVIPRWRQDDIMVSYATPGGGVGPHSDSFDVFLLQGEGQKRWRVCTHTQFDPDDDSLFMEQSGVKLLQHWAPDQEWILEPGDVLYVPPHFGREGTALSEGQTYSVGYLAPQHDEMLMSYAFEAMESQGENNKAAARRYQQPTLDVQEHPGEISSATFKDLRTIVAQLPKDDRFMAKWFGKYISASRGGLSPVQRETPMPLTALQRRMKKGEALCRHEGVRIFFAKHDHSIFLYVDGQEYARCSENDEMLAMMTMAVADITVIELGPNAATLNNKAWKLLQQLVNDGYLYLHSDRNVGSDDDGEGGSGEEGEGAGSGDDSAGSAEDSLYSDDEDEFEEEMDLQQQQAYSRRSRAHDEEEESKRDKLLASLEKH